MKLNIKSIEESPNLYLYIILEKYKKKSSLDGIDVLMIKNIQSELENRKISGVELMAPLVRE